MLIAQGIILGTFRLKVFICPSPFVNRRKTINESGAKVKYQDEERARIAIQKGKNIWVRVEEDGRIYNYYMLVDFQNTRRFFESKNSATK